MKLAGLILFLLAAAVSAQTNQNWSPYRYPVRAFGNREAVNLTPLFQWWRLQPLTGKTATNHDATAAADADTDRPLSAWRRVTGFKAGEAAGSWVVNAVIYTSPTIHTNARIFLNHPPVTEEQAFYALKTQLAQTEQTITSAQRTAKADDTAAQKAEERAQVYGRSGTKLARDGFVYYTRIANQHRVDAAAARDQQKQLEAAHEQVEKQFNAIPAKNGTYFVDWFAMAAGATKKGVPIYDLGVVNFNSP